MIDTDAYRSGHLRITRRVVDAMVDEIDRLRATTCDPVDITAIAERTGKSRGTVDQWRWRYQSTVPPFPPARWYPDRHPLWEWDDVSAWLTATNRTPKEPTP